MSDFISFSQPRTKFTVNGVYWDSRPDSADTAENSKRFTYRFIDPMSYTYKRMFGNVQSFDAKTIAIQTNSTIEFSTEGYFKTADGEMYRIYSAKRDTIRASRQAERLFKIPSGTETYIYGIGVEDAWEVK